MVGQVIVCRKPLRGPLWPFGTRFDPQTCRTDPGVTGRYPEGGEEWGGSEDYHQSPVPCVAAQVPCVVPPVPCVALSPYLRSAWGRSRGGTPGRDGPRAGAGQARDAAPHLRYPPHGIIMGMLVPPCGVCSNFSVGGRMGSPHRSLKRFWPPVAMVVVSHWFLLCLGQLTPEQLSQIPTVSIHFRVG